jgi:hypothetical protein
MFRMDEDRARFIDAVTKAVAVAAVVFGGGWTVYTYFNTREKEERTALIEARKPFETRRLELYIELSASAAKLAETTDPKEYKRQYRHFYELSIGPLALVGDHDVGTATVNFSHCADTADIIDRPCDGLAEEVSRACRRSIAAGWDLALPDDAVTYNKLERLRR